MALTALNLRVEVQSEEVNVKRGHTKIGNKPYTIAEQTVYVDLGHFYPDRIVVNLEDGAPPYAKGNYVIPMSALVINEFQQLAFGRIKLVKVVGSAAAAPAAASGKA